MEKRQPRVSKMFFKFSIFGLIAPFYNMRIKNIKYFLRSLCKESRQNWFDNKEAYKEVFIVTKWRSFNEDITELLK